MSSEIMYNGVEVPENGNVIYNGIELKKNKIYNILDEEKYSEFGEPELLEKRFIDKVYTVYGNDKNKKGGNNVFKLITKKIGFKNKLQEIKNSIKFYPNRVELIIGYEKRKIVIDKNQIIKSKRNFSESLKAKNSQQPLSLDDIIDIKKFLGEKLTLKDLLPGIIEENKFYWTGTQFDGHELKGYYFNSVGNTDITTATSQLRTIYKKKKI